MNKIFALVFSFQIFFFCTIFNSFSQCAVNLSTNSIYGFNDPAGSGGFSGFLCSGTDSVGTTGVNGYYDGDGYTVKLVSGSQVLFSVDQCTGNPVSMTITDSLNQIIPGAYSSSACPNSLSFTVPYTGTFVVVLNQNGICSGGGNVLIGQAYAQIQPGTNVPTCPDAGILNDTICGAIALNLDSPFVHGNTSLAYLTDPIDGYITSIGCTCSVPNNTLWYSYTAQISADSEFIYLTADSGSSFHSWLNVFVANDPGNPCSGGLFFLGCQEGPNDPIGIDTAIISLYGVNAGTTYYFMIDGFNGSTGGFSIAIRSFGLWNSSGYLNDQNFISLYPNPVNSAINISLKHSLKNPLVTIENTLGEQFFSKNYSDFENETIYTGDLPSGVYLINLTSSVGVNTRKIFIKN